MNNNYCATAISVDFINKKVYVESCSFESIENIKKAIVAYGDNPDDYEVTHEKPRPQFFTTTPNTIIGDKFPTSPYTIDCEKKEP